jgi:hypothetical protein
LIFHASTYGDAHFQAGTLKYIIAGHNWRAFPGTCRYTTYCFTPGLAAVLFRARAVHQSEPVFPEVPPSVDRASLDRDACAGDGPPDLADLFLILIDVKLADDLRSRCRAAGQAIVKAARLRSPAEISACFRGHVSCLITFSKYPLAPPLYLCRAVLKSGLVRW